MEVLLHVGPEFTRWGRKRSPTPHSHALRFERHQLWPNLSAAARRGEQLGLTIHYFITSKKAQKVIALQ